MNEVDNMIIKFKSRDKDRFESMLFNYGTTYLTDLRHGRILERSSHNKYKAPVQKPKAPVRPLKDTHTFTDWERKVPFDLYIKPKEILHTDPRKIPEFQVAFEDLEREQVRKTRPKVVMTPEISIDDVDESVLKLLLEDKYKTTIQKDYCGHSDKMRNNVVAPLVPVPAPAIPIKLPKVTPHVVPPEWRMASVTWDERQIRAYCDPNKEFWTGTRLIDRLNGK